jgi:enoyl-CoA hydratase
VRKYFFSLKPTIAAVRGRCFDWGNALQVFSDITIAADDAQVGSVGQTAGAAGLSFLRHYVSLIGYKRAREMALMGRTWSGRDASLIGLVNRAVREEDLDEIVLREARRIALLPLDGLVTGKAYAQLVYEEMGLGNSFTEMYFGHTMGLRIQFAPDEFSFFKEVKANGASAAIRKRAGRYDKLGDFGGRAAYPVIPDTATP